MIGFPLLLIPIAVYNIIAFLMRDVSFAAQLVTVPMMSGASWPVTLSDALLAFGLFLLLLEIVKGARPAGKYLTDHLLAFLILAGAAAEFVLLPPFATSTFFLLTLLALIDFICGISLGAGRRRRVREAAAPAMAQEDLPRETRVTPVVAADPAPVSVPFQTMEPMAVESAPPRPVVHSADEHPVRAEPILDMTADVAEIQRERRPDDVIVPPRIAPGT